MIGSAFSGSNDYVASAEMQLVIGKKSRELYDKRIAPYATNLSESQIEAIINFQRLVFTIDDYDEIVRDILEEIEDDVDDIEEDKLTPLNGNRLLEVLGSKDTSGLHNYLTFINSQSTAPRELIQRVARKVSDLLAVRA